MNDELWTTADVSAYLKIPAGTLRQWRHRGFGPKGFAVGGAVRYRRSVVEAWTAQQEAAETVGAA